MAVVKPFRGLRPPATIVKDLSCLPYDVMDSDEARTMAAGKECSLLHITRSEIDLQPGSDVHSDEVYNKSRDNFIKWQEKKWLKQDKEPYFYIYALIQRDLNSCGLMIINFPFFETFNNRTRICLK